MRFLGFLLVIGSIFSCRTLPQNNSQTARIETENGTVEGVFAPDENLNKYFGVPYAAPPVGDLRWKAPQPLANWEGTKSVKTFGNRPMQVKLWDDLIYRSQEMSEDCLYLNIWAPADVETAKLPVLFYIHGGGFVAGDGSELRYDGSSMAQKGMVVVTINYRLNIFGFMALPELTEESGYGGSGNYGLLDQVAALKWVKTNIGAFGGDPNKITIAGESAGSISVSSLMASPMSRDLISGAIGESGAAIEPTLAPVALKEAEAIGAKFTEAINHTHLEDLRALSAEELFEFYKNAENNSFPTVIDHHFYQNSLGETFNSQNQAQVPLLLGWNSAEMPAAVFMQGQEYTRANFQSRVKEVYGDSSAAVLDLYKHNTSEQIAQSASALASDAFIVYSSWKWFDLHRKNSEQPVYRYLFSKIRPQQSADSITPKPQGAGHAHEIEYALGNLSYIKAHDWTQEDYQVSDTMQEYFVNFIKSGDPNGPDLPSWPQAGKNTTSPQLMNIDTQSQAEEASHDDRYRFWESYYDEE